MIYSSSNTQRLAGRTFLIRGWREIAPWRVSTFDFRPAVVSRVHGPSFSSGSRAVVLALSFRAKSRADWRVRSRFGYGNPAAAFVVRGVGGLSLPRPRDDVHAGGAPGRIRRAAPRVHARVPVHADGLARRRGRCSRRAPGRIPSGPPRGASARAPPPRRRRKYPPRVARIVKNAPGDATRRRPPRDGRVSTARTRRSARGAPLPPRGGASASPRWRRRRRPPPRPPRPPPPPPRPRRPSPRPRMRLCALAREGSSTSTRSRSTPP